MLTRVNIWWKIKFFAFYSHHPFVFLTKNRGTEKCKSPQNISLSVQCFFFFIKNHYFLSRPCFFCNNLCSVLIKYLCICENSYGKHVFWKCCKILTFFCWQLSFSSYMKGFLRSFIGWCVHFSKYILGPSFLISMHSWRSIFLYMFLFMLLYKSNDKNT